MEALKPTGVVLEAAAKQFAEAHAHREKLGKICLLTPPLGLAGWDRND
jgi:hypothetical protein